MSGHACIRCLLATFAMEMVRLLYLKNLALVTTDGTDKIAVPADRNPAIDVCHQCSAEEKGKYAERHRTADEDQP